MSSKKNSVNITIYQAENGAIEFRDDLDHDTIWGTQKQIAEVFGVNVRTVNEHLINILKTRELEEDAVVRNFRITAVDGKSYNTKHYNLDAIISVGYRVNSKQATHFRKWATLTLKQHLTKGYTINKNRIGSHYEQFLRAVSDVRALLPAENNITSADILELISTFASTWFSLDAYDKDEFPTIKTSKKSVSLDAAELLQALAELKADLITKKQATELFAQEKKAGNVEGIVGNVLQTVFEKDAYPGIEEKAAHLLYFMVKNHPFTDGNKRSGAFAFVWFLRKTGGLRANLTPEALTAITLLIAESNPKDKEKMVGLVVMLIS